MRTTYASDSQVGTRLHPPPGDTWQYLETFSVVINGREVVLLGIWQVKPRGAAKHPSIHRTAPQTKNYLSPEISGVELRSPGLSRTVITDRC